MMTRWDKSRASGKVSGLKAENAHQFVGRREHTTLKRLQLIRTPVQALALFSSILVFLARLMSSFYLMPMATYPSKLSVNSILYTQKEVEYIQFCLLFIQFTN